MSERYHGSTEKTAESQSAQHEARKHHERLKDHVEKNAEKAQKSSHETANIRHEVKEHAISGAEYHKPQSEQRQPHPPRRTKRDKELAFDTIMHDVRINMSKPEQAFSKLIHQPIVEKTSEVAGKTIARPSGIAGAALAACVGLFSVYSVARFAGFQLSGSEMPLLLAIGFVAGVAGEFIYKSARSIVTKTRS